MKALSPICDLVSKASATVARAGERSWSAADDDHQKGGAFGFASRRLPHGHVGPNTSNWLLLLAADRRVAKTSLGVARLQLRGCADLAAPRLFHSVRIGACKPSCAQLLPAEQLNQSLAHRDHHRLRLSTSVAFAGSQTSEALDGRVPKSTGAFHRNEGELPNVCG